MKLKTFLAFITLVIIQSVLGVRLHAQESKRVTLYFSGSRKNPIVSKVDLYGAVLAKIDYLQSVNSTGWAELTLSSNKRFERPQKDVAYAAGYLESSVSYELIFNYWKSYSYNRYGQFLPKNINLRDFLQQQYLFVFTRSSHPKPHDEYWNKMNLLINQFDGLVDGYMKATKGTRFSFGNYTNTKEILYFLNAIGDLEDLENKFPEPKGNEEKLKASNGDWAFREDIASKDCSAFIRLGEDDVMVGHTTWRNFFAMLRVYKVYDMFKNSPAVSMSSSPGLLHSKDDFYTLSNGLVVMETTNSFSNKTLNQFITHQSGLSWQRVMIANYASSASSNQYSSGKRWTGLFETLASGTYCNQWMILDTLKVKKLLVSKAKNGKYSNELIKDLLWISEEMPGKVLSLDVSDVFVKNGFWASYNVPYIKEIYYVSGFGEKVKSSSEYSYESSSRAKIFARDASKIGTVQDMKNLMRYNNFKEDPLSQSNPGYAVASRLDLNGNITQCRLFGGVDSKVIAFNEQIFEDETFGPTDLIVHAISGPTYNQQTPFSWSGRCGKSKGHNSPLHLGVPELFDFQWEKMVYSR